MSEIETQELKTLKRRASDKNRRQRTVTGWVGVVLGTLICLVGLARANDVMVAAAFVAILYSGNRLPYAHVRELLPWGKK